MKMTSDSDHCIGTTLLEAAALGQTEKILEIIQNNNAISIKKSKAFSINKKKIKTNSFLRDTKDEIGRNCLHIASMAGHIETVKTLLEQNLDVLFQRDQRGQTALHLACIDGHENIVQSLIVSSTSIIDYQDILRGNSSLHEASWKGFSRTVQILCNNKANLNLRNFGGFSALHLASQNGHNETIRILLRGGCNPDIVNNYGDTALHTSIRYGHAGAARILHSALCDVNLQNKNGDTPLHIAAAMGRRKLTYILMEVEGIKYELKNLQNETPLDIATRKVHTEIIQILTAQRSTQSSSVKFKLKEKNKTQNSDANKSQASIHGRPRGSRKSPCKMHHRKSNNKNCIHWSPYGCHYYPDLSEFPAPNPDSLPDEPLSKGEQYFLDLAGNVKKGPCSSSHVCYCVPFAQKFEEKRDRDRKQLTRYLKQCHGKLAHKISYLEQKTQDQLSTLSNNMKETIAQERMECEERAMRHSFRQDISRQRMMDLQDSKLKADLTCWLERRIKQLNIDHDKEENNAIFRSLTRGSKRKRRSIMLELQCGNLRRAISEDEIAETEMFLKTDKSAETLVDKSILEVSMSQSPLHVRRNSAGDEHFTYFSTTETNNSSMATIMESSHSAALAKNIVSSLESSSNNEKFEELNVGVPKNIYQNCAWSESSSNLPLVSPNKIHPPIPPPKPHHFSILEAPLAPPVLPPKQNRPPPYRMPPRGDQYPSFHSSIRNNTCHTMPPIEEDDSNYMSMHSLRLKDNIGNFVATQSNLLLSTACGVVSDGGSHDSHNDSGYGPTRTGGGNSSVPSPSLSGSQGRADSCGPGSFQDINPVFSHKDMTYKHDQISSINKINLPYRNLHVSKVPNLRLISPRIKELQNKFAWVPTGSLV